MRGKIQSVYYRDKRGREPVSEFLAALSPRRRKKVVGRVEDLNGRRADAPPPEFPITSQIEGELRELRIRFGGTHFRILYQRSVNLVVLLPAFEKNTGAVPASEKATAKWRMANFKGAWTRSRESHHGRREAMRHDLIDFDKSRP